MKMLLMVYWWNRSAIASDLSIAAAMMVDFCPDVREYRVQRGVDLSSNGRVNSAFVPTVRAQIDGSIWDEISCKPFHKSIVHRRRRIPCLWHRIFTSIQLVQVFPFQWSQAATFSRHRASVVWWRAHRQIQVQWWTHRGRHSTLVISAQWIPRLPNVRRTAWAVRLDRREILDISTSCPHSGHSMRRQIGTSNALCLYNFLRRLLEAIMQTLDHSIIHHFHTTEEHARCHVQCVMHPSSPRRRSTWTSISSSSRRKVSRAQVALVAKTRRHSRIKVQIQAVARLTGAFHPIVFHQIRDPSHCFRNIITIVSTHPRRPSRCHTGSRWCSD